MKLDQTTAAFVIDRAEQHGFVREPTLGSYDSYLFEDAQEALEWMTEHHPDELAPNGLPWGDEMP